MTADADLITSLRTARERGERPAAPGVDLYGVDLSGADLRNADLRNADLRYANLYGVDLSGADLSRANLRDANLRDATLRGANLSDASLRDANLCNADLRDVNLCYAFLRDANLRYAFLPGHMPIYTPSGDGEMIPTPSGWRISIGCWRNRTLDDLAALIADEAEWPEATGDERERRRPILAAVHAQAVAQAAYYQDYITQLAEKWNGTRAA